MWLHTSRPPSILTVSSSVRPFSVTKHEKAPSLEALQIDEEMMAAVEEFFRDQVVGLDTTGIQGSVDQKGDYVEK